LILFDVTLYCNILCIILLYFILFFVFFYSILFHYIILYNIILCYIILYYIILYNDICVDFAFVLVLAFAVAAWGCNVLCQTFFMVSIAVLHVTPYALHDDC
jgi:hypothetical protein